MKLRDRQIFLETLKEVSDVFWAPTDWEFQAGGRRSAFIAGYHMLHLPEAIAESCNLEFSTPDLQHYWDKLHAVALNYKPHFDFVTGSEYDFEANPRAADDPILLAAQHVSAVGLDEFTFTQEEGKSHRAVRVTHNKTGKSFDFIDTEDPAMYSSCLTVVESRERKFSVTSMQQRLSAFTS